MFNPLRKLGRFGSSCARPADRKARLRLEYLEGRELLSIAPLGPSNRAGVLVQQTSNLVTYSTDYNHVAGGGASLQVYNGRAGQMKLLALNLKGVLATAPDHSVFYSPDGAHLDGGGATVKVYDGLRGAVTLTRLYNGGVMTRLNQTNEVFYSPDAKNLLGGGQTVRVYDGALGAVTLLPTRNGGVLTQVTSTNEVFFSPDLKDLTATARRVYDGTRGAVELVRTYGEGTLVRFVTGNEVYYSPDFKSLAGGGQTTRVYDGQRGEVGLVALQSDKGALVQFKNTKEVYLSRNYRNLGTLTGQTTRVYDGQAGELQLYAVIGGGVLAQNLTTHAVFYSPDAQNLGAAVGQTTLVYAGGERGAVRLWLMNGGGVLTTVASSGEVYFSRDFKNLATVTGQTQKVYGGTNGALSFVSLVHVESPSLQVDTRDNGLKIITLKTSTQTLTAANNDKLRMEYTGWLDDGTQFDSSRQAGRTPFEFTLGIGDVIAGWDQGVLGMKVGEVRKLIIPAALGYQDQVKQGIPPGSRLTFEIELLGINFVKTTNDSLSAVAEDSGARTIPFADVLGNDRIGRDGAFGQSLTISAVSSPVGGTVSISGNNIVFTPTANFAGPASFTYTAQSTGSRSDPTTATATVSFNVTQVPDAPTVTAATTAEDAQSTTGLVINRNSADAAGAVTHFKITAIAGGALFQNDGTTLIADGQFVTIEQAALGLKFTPSGDANTASGGTFGFSAQASTDASGTTLSTATPVAVTVTEVNDAPTAGDDPLSDVTQGSGNRVIPIATLLGNDTTGPANESGQTLSVIDVKNAVGGTVSIQGTDVVFALDPAFTGPAGFDYDLQDNGTTNGAADAKTDVGHVSFNVN